MLIKINNFVVPGLIRYSDLSFPCFWLVGRNEKSLCDKQKRASPEGEGFQLSLDGDTKNPEFIENFPLDEENICLVYLYVNKKVLA